MVNESLLRELEQLASEWDKKEYPLDYPAEELRTLIAQYLTPGTRVWYYYAAEWKTGVLLTRPSKDRPYWQIQRCGIGKMIDQVTTGPDTIRIYTDDTSKEETA